MTDGTCRIFIAPDDAGRRLDAVLALLCPGMGLRGRRRLCDEGLVLVNGARRRPGHHVAAGDEVALATAAGDLAGASPLAASSCATPPDTTSPDEIATDRSATGRIAAGGISAGGMSAGGTPIHERHSAPRHAPACEDLLAPLRPGREAHNAGLRLVSPSDWPASPNSPAKAPPHLVAVFKPGGLHSAALTGGQAPNAENLLPGLKLLNRLDGPTSGILMLAGTPAGERQWHEAEDAGKTRKTYIALCIGHLEAHTVVRAALDTARRSVTRVLDHDTADRLRHTEVMPLVHMGTDALAPVIASDGDEGLQEGITLVCCRIRKGARHQIRAHMAHIGHPLLGDALYGAPESPLRGECPLFLHHARIALPGFSAVCAPPWLGLLPVDAASTAEHVMADETR